MEKKKTLQNEEETFQVEKQNYGETLHSITVYLSLEQQSSRVSRNKQ